MVQYLASSMIKLSPCWKLWRIFPLACEYHADSTADGQDQRVRQRQQRCHRGAGKTAAVLRGLKRRGEELIGRSQGADKDLAAKGASINLIIFFLILNSKLWLPQHPADVFH